MWCSRKINRVLKPMVVMLLVFLFLVRTNSHARSRFELIMNYLKQKGNDGNQVFDGSGNQNMSVYEPILFFDTDLGPDTILSGSAVYDLWSSASDSIVDTASGASGATGDGGYAYQYRYGFNIGLSHEFEDWTVKPRIGFSKEFDYRSINGGLTVQKSFAQDNFTLSLGTQYYHDTMSVYDVIASTFTGNRPKRVLSVSLGASQILSPSDLIFGEYSVTRQTGALEGNVNSVSVGGSRVNEVLPDSRLRHSLVLHYIRGFNDQLSGHLEYKFYVDSWGLTAHVIEPSLYASLLTDALFLKLSYRFYTQTSTDYSRSSFTTAQEFMTSDSDLEAFVAHQILALASHRFDFKRGFFKALEPSLSAWYYTRSNGLNIGGVQAGVAVEF